MAKSTDEVRKATEAKFDAFEKGLTVVQPNEKGEYPELPDTEVARRIEFTVQDRDEKPIGDGKADCVEFSETQTSLDTILTLFVPERLVKIVNAALKSGARNNVVQAAKNDTWRKKAGRIMRQVEKGEMSKEDAKAQLDSLYAEM